jgi:hypothetical protein
VFIIRYAPIIGFPFRFPFQQMKNHSIDQQNFHFIIQQCEESLLPPPQASLSIRRQRKLLFRRLTPPLSFAASFPPP